MARQAEPKKQKRKATMANYHGHLKSISRADGRSATGAIAYRAACKIVDERTGLEFDFTKKKGVEHSQIFFPPDEEHSRPDLHDRSNLWNVIEKKETKSNAQVAREFEFSFPHELNAEQRQRMLSMFCTRLAKNHGVVVDASIHVPHGKNADKRNYHAHVMFSTRRFENGQFTEKTREFSKDPYNVKELENRRKKGLEDFSLRLHGRKNGTELLRELYEVVGNKCLVEAGFEATLDRRSYAERGIDQEPTVHEGAGRAMANRGRQSDTHDKNIEIIERNKKLSELENEIIVATSIVGRLDKEYSELSQLQIAYDAEVEQHKQMELSQPKLTLDSLSLIKHIQHLYDPYSQELIKRTKVQDEAINSGDNNRALYYMQIKYESIGHCLDKQSIDELGKTLLFIKNDKGLLEALLQQRIMSKREIESAERSVNNALTSCERTIQRKSTVSMEIGKTPTDGRKHENTRNHDNSDHTFDL